MYKSHTTYINKKLLIASALCAIGGFMLSACSPTVTQRGNKLEDYQIEEVVLGIHTQSDVLRILGSPTTRAPFNDNIWYYIGQEKHKRGILDPKVVDERIVIVAFDEQGTVQTINEADADRINIPIEREKTETHGNELTVMQQLLGNLGRFNPQDGSSGSPGR